MSAEQWPISHWYFPWFPGSTLHCPLRAEYSNNAGIRSNRSPTAFRNWTSKMLSGWGKGETTTKSTFRQRSAKSVSAVKIFLMLSKEALRWPMKYLLTRPRCSNSVWRETPRYLYGSGPCSGISNANWWNFCVSLQTAYQWACCYCYAGVIVRFRSFFVYLDVFEKPYINKHSWEFSDFYKDCNLRHPQDWGGGNKSGKQDMLTILITYGTSWRKEVSQRALRYVLSKTSYSWS